MKQTIYVDVLVIINVYINYGLLLLTALAVRFEAERLRILLASLLGGIYSLIILIPDVSDNVISLSRIPATAVMVLLVFGYGGIKSFLRNCFSFLGINIVFAGVMFAVWLWFCPENMYYNSGVVYFGIDAFTLVALTAGVYAVLRLLSRLNKSRLPGNFTYSMRIFISGKEFLCRAFYDTGNCLRDPFSGEGVIIVGVDILKDVTDINEFDNFENRQVETGIRLIPVKSVSGTKLLPSLRAEKILINGAETEIIIEKPVIAVCKEKILGGEYGALLYSGIFENISKVKGETYVLHN